MNKKILISAVFCALTMAACEKGEKGSIKILSMSPEPTVALKVGQKVDLKLEFEYTLNRDAGRAGLSVQPGDGIPNIAKLDKDVELKRGSGKAVITAVFVVPDSEEVVVNVPLYAGAGSSRTEIVDQRTYNVIRKKK
jgi:hypothetical protein